MDGGIMTWFGFLILGCGIYVLYAWFNMMQTGAINGPLLLGKSFEESKCKDRDSFVKKTKPMMLVLGFFTTAFGVWDVLLNMFWIGNELFERINMALMVLCVVNIVIFGFRTKRLREQYF